MKFNTSTHNL